VIKTVYISLHENTSLRVVITWSDHKSDALTLCYQAGLVIILTAASLVYVKL